MVMEVVTSQKLDSPVGVLPQEGVRYGTLDDSCGRFGPLALLIACKSTFPPDGNATLDKKSGLSPPQPTPNEKRKKREKN
jgi:hypothetical protein